MRKPSKQARREFVKFSALGLIAFLMHNVVYMLLTYFDVNATLAYSLGYISWAVSNFLLSTYVTFRTRATVKRAVGFAACIAIYYLVQMTIFTLIQLTPVPEILVTPIVYACAFPINFIMVRWVMKR